MRKGDILADAEQSRACRRGRGSQGQPRHGESRPDECRRGRPQGRSRHGGAGCSHRRSQSRLARKSNTREPRRSRPRTSRASRNLTRATAALGQAEANLNQAQSRLRADMAGPTAEERAIAEAKVVYAEAALADIEAKLAKTTLVAPVDGVVTPARRRTRRGRLARTAGSDSRAPRTSAGSLSPSARTALGH